MGFPWLLLLLLLSLLCGGLQQEDQGYQLNLKEPVLVVQEGLCASMSCSFIIPRTYQFYPLTVYWFREGDSHRDDPVATNDQQRQVKREALGRFHLLGNPSDLKCSLGIRRARHTDQGNYFFRVEQGYVKYNYKATMLRVLVTALTEKPAIHVAEPLVSGHPGRLTCSLPGACETTSLQFSWAGEMLGPSPPTSAELSLTPGPGDHGKNLSCQVILLGTLRTTETTICLNVSYPPQNLTTHISFEATSVLKIKKSTSALSVLGGQTVWLLCGADSNPPAELSWFPRSPGLKATTLSTNTAKLELRLPETTEDAEFNCHAQNPLGSRNVSLRLSVLSPLQLLGPSCSWEAQDLRCSCSSCARPAPALSWWLDQRLLPENRSNASFQVTSNTEEYWANSSLSLRKGFGAGLPVRCEARNVQERQSAWVLLQPGKPEAQSAAVIPILGAAGVLTLLSLCLCLVAVACVVRARRNVVSAGSGAMANEDPVMDSVAWGSRTKHWPDSPPDQMCPEPGEAQELHYANLSFHERAEREPQDREGSERTEYSEIKTSK
ncbi:sialic acid-binding Ig-like lectin 5 [Sorex fumeus]|uniref:sialic acid-binding Ig-like lectin 5 n=1 Tax=Sorex fumeus TaxID=62283 RepID=UPI0024AE2951|nr:sialic acid-binding Ig-like lectin 5 [Sorex fumeus]